jgi:hypothetical protein
MLSFDEPFVPLKPVVPLLIYGVIQNINHFFIYHQCAIREIKKVKNE